MQCKIAPACKFLNFLLWNEKALLIISPHYRDWLWFDCARVISIKFLWNLLKTCRLLFLVAKEDRYCQHGMVAKYDREIKGIGRSKKHLHLLPCLLLELTQVPLRGICLTMGITRRKDDWTNPKQRWLLTKLLLNNGRLPRWRMKVQTDAWKRSFIWKVWCRDSSITFLVKTFNIYYQKLNLELCHCKFYSL